MRCVADTRIATNGSPNSWITASFDPKLNLVYIPTGNNGPDIWGGNRDALVERCSSSIVALDVNTGKRAWSYQTVHHDLWDMDVPRNRAWSMSAQRKASFPRSSSRPRWAICSCSIAGPAS